MTVTVEPLELLQADIFAEATVRRLRDLVPALDALTSARKELAAAQSDQANAAIRIANAEAKITAALTAAGQPGASLISDIATALNLTKP